jgi:hypothetical protein
VGEAASAAQQVDGRGGGDKGHPPVQGSELYTDNLQVRVGPGVKRAMQELAKRRGRRPSDEMRAAFYAHLRRAGIVLPHDPYVEAEPMSPEAIAAIARELAELVGGSQDDPGTPG